MRVPRSRRRRRATPAPSPTAGGGDRAPRRDEPVVAARHGRRAAAVAVPQPRRAAHHVSVPPREAPHGGHAAVPANRKLNHLAVRVAGEQAQRPARRVVVQVDDIREATLRGATTLNARNQPRANAGNIIS